MNGIVRLKRRAGNANRWLPMSLKIIPLELSNANALVRRWHRHHKPAQGHKFSIGVFDTKENALVGAAIIGRPVARMVNHKTTVEVVRLVTDGTKNACSILYAAAARSAREMGYEKIQTYILESETGASLKAAGWYLDAEFAGGGQWKHTDGNARRTDQPTSLKQRWAKLLNESGAIMAATNKACTRQGQAAKKFEGFE